MAKLTPQQEHQQLIKANIVGSYANADELIEKGGKKVPIGTTHNGYKKVGEGKWQKVSDKGLTKKEHSEQADRHDSVKKEVSDTNTQYHAAENSAEHREAAKNLDDKEYSDDEVMGKNQSQFTSEEDEKESKEWIDDYFKEYYDDFDDNEIKFSLDKFTEHFGISKDLAQTIIFNLEGDDIMQDVARGDYDGIEFGESDFNDAYWDIVSQDEEFAGFMGEEYEEDDEDEDDEDDD